MDLTIEQEPDKCQPAILEIPHQLWLYMVTLLFLFIYLFIFVVFLHLMSTDRTFLSQVIVTYRKQDLQ